MVKKTASRKTTKATQDRKRGGVKTAAGRKPASRKPGTAMALSAARKTGASVPKKRGGTKRKAARKAR